MTLRRAIPVAVLGVLLLITTAVPAAARAHDATVHGPVSATPVRDGDAVAMPAAPMQEPVEDPGDGSESDPDRHDPVEAERSDRSIGSWLLVGAAALAAMILIGAVFHQTREHRTGRSLRRRR